MLKKTVWFLVVILTFSMFYIYHQHKQIEEYKKEKVSYNKEFKAQIQTLIIALENVIDKEKELDKEYLKSQMNLTSMSFRYTTYNHNSVVSHALNRLQYLVYNIETYSKEEIHQISILLKEIIKPKDAEIDIEACKKISDYILSIK